MPTVSGYIGSHQALCEKYYERLLFTVGEGKI
jgi:hypothetical protein